MLRKNCCQETNERSIVCPIGTSNKPTRSLFALLMVAIMVISSIQLSFFTVFAVSSPSVPTKVKASSASYSSIKVSWTSVKSAQGYEIYRYNSKTKAYTHLKVISATSYINTGLITGTTYYYRVRAYKTVSGKNIYGNTSGAVSAKPKLATPSSFIATKSSSTGILLSWKAVSGAYGYLVYSLNLNTGTYKCIKSTTSTLFLDSGLSSGSHYYKVTAYRKVNSANVYSTSSPVKVVTLSKPTTTIPVTTTKPTTTRPVITTNAATIRPVTTTKPVTTIAEARTYSIGET
ncbi:MAG: fibronectin type III domain-containing protein, partial [Eubacteriales bacterium]